MLNQTVKQNNEVTTMTEDQRLNIVLEVECTIGEIEHLTKYNNHTTAAIVGARVLGNKKLETIFSMIEKIQDQEGHLPMNMSDYRREKLTEMFNYAIEILDEDTYKKFHSAF